MTGQCKLTKKIPVRLLALAELGFLAAEMNLCRRAIEFLELD
jgi:hypothetical protein